MNNLIEKITKWFRVTYLQECRFEGCDGKIFDWGKGFMGIHKDYCDKCGKKQWRNENE